MIGSSSARIEERLTDGDVIVVEDFREPLLGQRLLGVLDISLRDEVVVGLRTCGGVLFWPGGPAPQRKCAWFVIHNIKEVEGVRKQEVQEDKRDEEIADEMNGEVEEVTQRAHET